MHAGMKFHKSSGIFYDEIEEGYRTEEQWRETCLSLA